MIPHKLFEIKEQSTCETCLPICLMTLLKEKSINVEDSEEMNILIEGIKFTKLDYSTGQLVYICNKFNVEVEQYIDHPVFHEILSKLKYPPNMKIIAKKIDKNFIEQISAVSPVIIYLDKYYLDKIYHFPHFIILKSILNGNATIIDPWDGKIKELNMKTLLKSISSLRNKFKINPKVIRIL